MVQLGLVEHISEPCIEIHPQKLGTRATHVVVCAVKVVQVGVAEKGVKELEHAKPQAKDREGRAKWHVCAGSTRGDALGDVIDLLFDRRRCHPMAMQSGGGLGLGELGEALEQHVRVEPRRAREHEVKRLGWVFRDGVQNEPGESRCRRKN